MSGGRVGRDAADERRSLPVGHFDLLRDLPQPGCAVCRGASRSAWRYLDGLLWEGVTDPGIRTQTRASHGFCREHATMAISVASQQSGQLGMAILFEDLLGHLEEEVSQPRERTRGLRSRRNTQPSDPLAPHAECHACLSGRATERNYLCVLARASATSEVAAAAAAQAPCLCHRHLRQGLTLDELGDDDRMRLVGIYTKGSERLRAELAEFIRKRDYRFASEPVSESEATAWFRAVQAIVGMPAPRSFER
jgi:Family of unknown function (DUF6062)